jgi:hypothetical protein
MPSYPIYDSERSETPVTLASVVGGVAVNLQPGPNKILNDFGETARHMLSRRFFLSTSTGLTERPCLPYGKARKK